MHSAASLQQHVGKRHLQEPQITGCKKQWCNKPKRPLTCFKQQQVPCLICTGTALHPSLCNPLSASQENANLLSDTPHPGQLLLPFPDALQPA